MGPLASRVGCGPGWGVHMPESLILSLAPCREPRGHWGVGANTVRLAPQPLSTRAVPWLSAHTGLLPCCARSCPSLHGASRTLGPPAATGACERASPRWLEGPLLDSVTGRTGLLLGVVAGNPLLPEPWARSKRSPNTSHPGRRQRRRVCRGECRPTLRLASCRVWERGPGSEHLGVGALLNKPEGACLVALGPSEVL